MASVVEVNLFSFSSDTNFFSKLINGRNILPLIREIVCYNQGELAQYKYMASLKHRNMKDICNSGNLDKISLIDSVDKLDEYLFNGLQKICKKNFEYLLKYFEDRKGPKPRMCLKCNTEDEEITDLFRDRDLGRTYSGIKYPISTNTGFSHVYEKGVSFICNNIPAAVSAGYYKNKRLDQNKALRYKASKWKESRIRKAGEQDPAWVDCWKETINDEGETIRPKPEECYKSTLIIPLTLINNDLTEEFRKIFKIDIDKVKTIYGYLCFDNQSTDYFVESDNKIGYVVADILSLYIIVSMMYQDYSNTYRDAKEKIN